MAKVPAPDQNDREQNLSFAGAMPKFAALNIL